MIIKAATSFIVGVMALILTILGVVSIVTADLKPLKAAGAQFSPAVKPPNTAPTAADPAQVVVLGPNSAGLTPISDPCTFQGKQSRPLISTVGLTQLVAGVAGQNIYICSWRMTNASAAVVGLIEGAGTTCTSPLPVWGGALAANGESFASNTAVTYGNGQGTVGATAIAGNGLCLQQTGTAVLSGGFTFVQQ